MRRRPNASRPPRVDHLDAKKGRQRAVNSTIHPRQQVQVMRRSVRDLPGAGRRHGRPAFTLTDHVRKSTIKKKTNFGEDGIP